MLRGKICRAWNTRCAANRLKTGAGKGHPTVILFSSAQFGSMSRLGRPPSTISLVGNSQKAFLILINSIRGRLNVSLSSITLQEHVFPNPKNASGD